MSMSQTFTEPKCVGDVLLDEGDHYYSRKTLTIVTGQAAVLPIGAVLGKITASGKFTKHVNGAADGTQTAAAVLIEETDARTADAKAICIVRDAIVTEQGLVWDASVNDAAKRLAAKTQLEAAGIVVREGA
jgi:hypothetical protein